MNEFKVPILAVFLIIFTENVQRSPVSFACTFGPGDHISIPFILWDKHEVKSKIMECVTKWKLYWKKRTELKIQNSDEFVSEGRLLDVAIYSPTPATGSCDKIGLDPSQLCAHAHEKQTQDVCLSANMQLLKVDSNNFCTEITPPGVQWLLQKSDCFICSPYQRKDSTILGSAFVAKIASDLWAFLRS